MTRWMTGSSIGTTPRRIYISLEEGTLTINRAFIWTGSLAGTTTIRLDEIQRTHLNGSGSKLFIDLEGKDPIAIHSRFLRKQDRKALLEILISEKTGS